MAGDWTGGWSYPDNEKKKSEIKQELKSEKKADTRQAQKKGKQPPPVREKEKTKGVNRKAFEDYTTMKAEERLKWHTLKEKDLIVFT